MPFRTNWSYLHDPDTEPEGFRTTVALERRNDCALGPRAWGVEYFCFEGVGISRLHRYNNQV